MDIVESIGLYLHLVTSESPHTRAVLDREQESRELLVDAAAEIERLRAERHAEMQMEAELRSSVERLRGELAKACEDWRVAFGENEKLRAELTNARNAAIGISTFLTNEEMAWACDSWPWLGGLSAASAAGGGDE